MHYSCPRQEDTGRPGHPGVPKWFLFTSNYCTSILSLSPDPSSETMILSSLHLPLFWFFPSLMAPSCLSSDIEVLFSIENILIWLLPPGTLFLLPFPAFDMWRFLPLLPPIFDQRTILLFMRNLVNEYSMGHALRYAQLEICRRGIWKSGVYLPMIECIINEKGSKIILAYCRVYCPFVCICVWPRFLWQTK